MPGLYEQLGRLRASVDDNTAVTERIDNRFRRWRRLTVAAVVIAFVGFVTALVARDAVDDANARLTDTKLAACVQFNVQRQEVRAAMVEVAARSIVRLARDPANLTDSERALVDAYRLEASAAAVEELPYRDCTPAGIADYYRNLPVDPNR